MHSHRSWHKNTHTTRRPDLNQWIQYFNLDFLALIFLGLSWVVLACLAIAWLLLHSIVVVSVFCVYCSCCLNLLYSCCFVYVHALTFIPIHSTVLLFLKKIFVDFSNYRYFIFACLYAFMYMYASSYQKLLWNFMARKHDSQIDISYFPLQNTNTNIHSHSLSQNSSITRQGKQTEWGKQQRGCSILTWYSIKLIF